MSKPSNRRLALQKLKEIAKKARNGRYLVKRGAMAWMEFPFAKYKYALSIQVDSRDWLAEQISADCALEFAAAIPGSEDLPEIDDELMDEFGDDADAIILEWLRWADDLGNVVAGFSAGKVTEFHDTDIRVQGLTAKFTIQL